MWGESSKEQCEVNCQCSGLITERFKINSGNSSTKRRRDEALTHNFKLKMNPHSIDFAKSPSSTPKRRVLGEITNSTYPASPNRSLESPITSLLLNSPKLNLVKRSSSKINRVLEERSRFKMSSDKENELHVQATCLKLDMDEETNFSEPLSPIGSVLQRSRTVKNWTLAKMTADSPQRPKQPESSTSRTIFGHVDDFADIDTELDTLHDLDAEFDGDNFDQCTNYEIISTDSPDIISKGRTTTARKVSSKNFDFGAPLAATEQSTSFNKPNATATRMLNFQDEAFEFTSPESLRPKTNQAVSVKKSLKFFSETPTKNSLRHESSSSSIGSMSCTSPQSGSKLRLFPSESTTSMESGFISEIEEPFLEIDEASSSPKVADFSELLSGEIKDNLSSEFSLKRPLLCRSLSYNPEACKARISLFSRGDSEEKRSQKRQESSKEYELNCKRRKANDGQLLRRSSAARPVLQRAYSENAASIMSALARSASNPDLIGDFSLPFALPITSGNHSDLKSISCETLATLIQGGFKNSVTEFQVIDCRYPYEFSGGHISCALNLYTPAQVLSLIDNKEWEQSEGRKIIVFHCEFSLERGPKLSRFLRSSDRNKNKENYPSLHYPEIYLLHEGYSAFYKKYPHLCTPTGYTTMLDPEFKTELSTFRRLYPTSGRRSFMM